MSIVKYLYCPPPFFLLFPLLIRWDIAPSIHESQNAFVSGVDRGTRPTFLTWAAWVNTGHETVYDVTPVDPECTFIALIRCR
jgi:hypothetical protein